MKIKLVFIIVIVLMTACSRKTLQSKDYSYYKQEMEKSKRQTTLQKSNENNPEVTVAKKQGENIYLTGDDKARFANLLQVNEENIQNEKLYAAIGDWLGTPYNWGGTSKNGVDCSAYVQDIYQKVYANELPRTSIEQFYLDTKSHFKDQKYLKEGDLIFFRLRHEDKVVSHVGIYLQNGKFTGSNSPNGVEIVDLNANYWQDRYVASARLLNNQ